MQVPDLYVIPNSIFLSVKPKKLPFFCMLEEREQKKYRFFLVLRAGNDADYREMITK
jgi:hypothetical protein